MRQCARWAFRTAPAVVVITLTAALAACGSMAAPASSHPAADAASSAGRHTGSGRAPGASSTAVPPVARRVQCPAVIPPVRLPGSARQDVLVQPRGSVQPDGPVQLAGPIPAGFRPVAVVRCVTVTSVRHGVIRIDQRRQAAIAGLSALVAALREASAPRPKGPLPACMVPVTSRPWFVLVSATGQVIYPLLPLSLCGEPIEPVLASLNSLHWITLGTVALHPVPIRPPLRGSPVLDITPAITVPS